MNPLRILVADDFESFRMAISEWLGGEGHTIEMAKNGRDAARLLAWERFDLLITDIIMPDGDGIELIHNVRKSRPALKIVAISAGGSHFGPAYYVNLAKKLGADAILLKPFDREQLREVMHGLFPSLVGQATGN